MIYEPYGGGMTPTENIHIYIPGHYPDVCRVQASNNNTIEKLEYISIDLDTLNSHMVPHMKIQGWKLMSCSHGQELGQLTDLDF